MSQPPTIASLAEQLAALKAGYRAWFWLCTQTKAPHPPLVITSFQKDPDMRALREQVRSIPTPAQADTCMGFVNMTQHGTLQFGSSVLSKKMLEQLADWTKHNSPKHKSLRRLKNATFLNISSKGVVLDKIEESSLWDSIPDAIVPGTIAQAAANIKRLREGRDYWFYMCSEPSGGCFLYLGSSKRDPEGAEFGKSIVDIKLRYPNSNKFSQGVFRELPSGKLAFITSKNISMTASIVTQLLQKYPSELKSLQGVRIIHLKDGDFGKMIIVNHTPEQKPKKDLSHLVSILQSMDGTQEAYFWFAAESKILVLEKTTKALKEAAKKIGGAGIRGKLVMAKRGKLEFQIKQDAPALLKSLASFVSKNIQDWPDLKKMNGAYVVHRNSAGELVARYKDSALWSFLNTRSTK